MGEILIFDVETTGLKPESEQIIELCIQGGLEPNSPSKTWRFKPDVPITPGAQKVHGISMKDLVDCPPFAEHASEIRSFFDRAKVIVGYNVEFDLSFIQSEFQRLKQPPISIRDKSIVDPYIIWRKSEPRNLSSAYQRFVGKDLEGAHAATADVAATGEVLQGMLAFFDLKDKSWEQLSEFCRPSQNQWVGPTYHFQWKEERLVFGFGKHKDRSLEDVLAEDDGGYTSWLLRSDFPPHVKTILEETPGLDKNELKTWLEDRFGRLPT